MEVTPEQWAAFLLVAQAKRPLGLTAAPHGIIGRSITKAVNVVVFLWGRYHQHLIPFLTQLAIAALDALAAAQPDIQAVNPPGPE